MQAGRGDAGSLHHVLLIGITVGDRLARSLGPGQPMAPGPGMAVN